MKKLELNKYCPFSPDNDPCENWCPLYQKGICDISRIAHRLNEIVELINEFGKRYFEQEKNND